MMGPILLSIGKCDGTVEHHHFIEDTELISVLINGKKRGEMHLLIQLDGENPFLVRRWVAESLRRAMKEMGRYEKTFVDTN